MIKKNSFGINLEIVDENIELCASDINKIVGKTISMDLTSTTKGKNCSAKFIISNVDGKLIGKINYFGIYPSYIRRIIGKNISIVEDSFLCKAKDAVIRVKPFLITRKRVHKSVRTALRKECADFIKKFASGRDCQQFFSYVLSLNLQKTMSKKLKKVYPLAVCEIRTAKVEKFFEPKPEAKFESKSEAEVKSEESNEDFSEEE